MIKFRRFQEAFIQVALRKARSNLSLPPDEQDRVVVADVHPGSGKTLAVLAAADRLFSEGFIDSLVVFVPRLNLAAQFEEDWNRNFRGNLEWPSAMREIYWRENVTPLFIVSADGYVTTYSSLVSEPALHMNELRQRRFALVVDEAQQLGIDWNGATSTASAAVVDGLSQFATIIFVLSGTPYRADNSKLWGAKYSPPDAEGNVRLEPDVRATYREGVRDGYLRGFEFVLHEGEAIWQQFGADPMQLSILEASNAGKSIRKVLQHKGFWQPIIDKCIEQLCYQRQAAGARFCMLVAADTQSHAREIKQYIDRKYPDLKTQIAISEDGKEAKQTLADFRNDKGDILVTVQMAYVGYDYKPISHLVILTSYRTEGYLRQLIARGLRVWDRLSPELQTCYTFVPNDCDMDRFVRKLREESRAGAQEREKLKRETESSGERQDSFDQVLDAWINSVYAMGLDPTGDLDPEEYEKAERLKRQLNVIAPSTELVRFAKAWDTGELSTGKSAQYLTMNQKMKAARSLLQTETRRCDKSLGFAFGTTNGRLFRRLGAVDNVSSLSEIEERVKIVRRWIEQGRYD